MHYFSNKIF